MRSADFGVVYWQRDRSERTQSAGADEHGKVAGEEQPLQGVPVLRQQPRVVHPHPLQKVVCGQGRAGQHRSGSSVIQVRAGGGHIVAEAGQC